MFFFVKQIFTAGLLNQINEASTENLDMYPSSFNINLNLYHLLKLLLTMSDMTPSVYLLVGAKCLSIASHLNKFFCVF